MTNTSDLVDAFVRARETLLRAADAVSPDARLTPFVGHWSLMDVLAHLVGWDYTNLNAIEELNAGSVPDFYRHYDPGWAAYNQQLIERYGAGDWDELRASLAKSQETVIAMLRLLTEDELIHELSEPGRRRSVTIAAILRAAIRDEQQHAGQIREFVESLRTA